MAPKWFHHWTTWAGLVQRQLVAKGSYAVAPHVLNVPYVWGGRYAYFQVFYSVNEFYIFFSRNFYILIIGLNYQQGIADIINDDIYVEP